MFLYKDEGENTSIGRFRSMLKTNDIFFFDAIEFEEIINHYLSFGAFPLAKKAVKMGLSQHPASVDLKLLKVEILIMDRKIKEAENLLDEIHHLEPSNEDVFIQKAKLLSLQELHLQAIEVLKQALEVSSDEGEIFSLIGMEYLELDRYEEAKEYFIKTVEIDQDEEMLFYVIYCFGLLNQKTQAIDYLNKLLDKRPYAEEAWYYLGKEYLEQQQYQQALTALDFAIISDDLFVGAYFEKGKALEHLGRYEDALETYLLTTQLDDPTDFAYLRMGYCYEKMGKDDLAIKFFLKAHELDPLGQNPLIAISDFYERNGKYHQALHYMSVAVNNDDLNIRFWKRYARLNHALDYLEEAEWAYKMAIENGNLELDTWINRGDILTQLGNYEDAIKNFERATYYHRGKVELEYRLAGLYFRLFQSEKGSEHLDKALELDSSKMHILHRYFPDISSPIEISPNLSDFLASRKHK